MKITRNKIIFVSLTLIVSFSFSAGLVGCSTSTAAPGSVQPSSDQRLAPVGSPVPALITPPGTPPYPQPTLTPSSLPPSVKWNPDEGTYYDSRRFLWNQTTNQYEDVYQPLNLGRCTTQTVDEWLNQHENSKDEIDIAIINYWKALQDWNKQQSLENPQEWEMRQDWRAGNEKGKNGPISILTNLGIQKLQRLVDKVHWDNPLTPYIEIGVCEACRTNINEIGFWEHDIVRWKQEFNNRALNGNLRVDEIAQAFASGKADEKTIHRSFARLGIFALPQVYELVNNKGNTDLIKYLPDILPLDKIKEFNVKAGVTDDATLKQALASCKDYIEIIKTLHAD